MGLFEHFPYTNFHGLNLDWILQKLKDLEEASARHEQWISNWSVTDYYSWTRTDEDHSGGSLVYAKSDDCFIRSITYKKTGRIVEYEIVFYPDPDGTFPMTGKTIWIDLPGWIYGYPTVFELYMFEEGRPTYQADYWWRKSDTGKLRLWVEEPERHQYSVHGYVILAESEDEPLDDVPNA